MPFTTSNTCVRVFRHAISLDERRAKFKQNTWNRPEPSETTLAASDKVQAEKENEQDENDDHHHHSHSRERSSSKKVSLRQLEREYSDLYETPTNVEEVSGSPTYDTVLVFDRVPSGLVCWVSYW